MSTLKAELASAQQLVKTLRAAVKQERMDAKRIREQLRLTKYLDQCAKKAEREEKRIARIQALELKLEQLRLKQQSPKAIRKANQKASAPVVIEKAVA